MSSGIFGVSSGLMCLHLGDIYPAGVSNQATANKELKDKGHSVACPRGTRGSLPGHRRPARGRPARRASTSRGREINLGVEPHVLVSRCDEEPPTRRQFEVRQHICAPVCQVRDVQRNERPEITVAGPARELASAEEGCETWSRQALEGLGPAIGAS